MLAQVDAGKVANAEATYQAIVAKLLPSQVDHHTRSPSAAIESSTSSGHTHDCRRSKHKCQAVEETEYLSFQASHQLATRCLTRKTDSKTDSKTNVLACSLV